MKTTRGQRMAIGIDFGGTRVKMGLVRETGRIVRAHAFPTREASTPEAWLEAVAPVVEQWRRSGARIAGLGVGVPGFVDFERGFIHELTNVPGWRGVPLARLLRRRFGLPAFVDNDVNAMALGECRFGAGRPYRHAVMATLGTGIGGALLMNGAVYRGAYSMAGEIGHVTINMRGRRTRTGRGGLETYVGNRPIAAIAVKAIRAGRRSMLKSLVRGELSRITPKLIAQAAARGDALSREIFDHVADCLAAAFASITYLLQPQVFIVGGGVAQSGKVLFEPLRRHLAERLSPFFGKRIRVLAAALGEQAGVVGCATLVFEGRANNF